MTGHLAPPPPEQAFRFLGFTLPTYTPIPDQLIDELLPLLNGSELKVVLYICRRTYGFGKVSDNISLSQLLDGIVKKNGQRLDYGTGLSKPTLLKTLRDLDDKGIIATIRRASSDLGDEATNYRLRFAEGVPPLIRPRPPVEPEPVGWRTPSYTPRDKETLPGGRSTDFTTPVVKKVIPQETAVQETVLQETADLVRDKAYPTNNNNSNPGEQNTNVIVASFASVQEPVVATLQKNTDRELLPASSSVAQFPTPPIADAPLSPANQAAAQALAALGIGKKAAQCLATHYQAEKIAEKIEFLAFLQDERPDTVVNPRGWLRRAIEEDYGPPDGFITAEERAQLEAEAEEEAQRAAAAEQSHQAFAAQVQAKQEAWQRQLQERYGTTEEAYQLWAEVLTLAKYGQPDLHYLYERAQILRCTEETVLLGFEHVGILRKLDHPGTMAALKRHLKMIAKRPLEVETVLLPVESMGDFEKDGAG